MTPAVLSLGGGCNGTYHDGADVAVLLLAGGQPSGPGLPVSVSPPGAHHRVGTPILLLIMMPIPAWTEGSLCLPLALSLFWEWHLHPAPPHNQGTSLLGVVQAWGGPCSQMLMVVNAGWGDSRSLGQAAGAGSMAKLEHVHVKSSTPSPAEISLSLAHTLPSKERCHAAVPGVKCMSVGIEEGKCTHAKMKSGRALQVLVIDPWERGCRRVSVPPNAVCMSSPCLMQSNPLHHQDMCSPAVHLSPWGSASSPQPSCCFFWARPLFSHPQRQGVDENLLERAVPGEKGLGGGCFCTWGSLTHRAAVLQVPGAGRRGGWGAGGQATGCLRASSWCEVGSTGRRLCVCSCSCPGTCPTPGWGPCLPGRSSGCAEPPRGTDMAVVVGAVSCWRTYPCALAGSGAGLHGGADELWEEAV